TSVQSAINQMYANQRRSVRWYVAARLALGLLDGDRLSGLLPEQGTIVDLGCGYGLLAHQLAILGPKRHVIGIDADAQRIRVARDTVGSTSSIEFLCADATGLELPPATGIVMVDFLHHIPLQVQPRVLAAVTI